MGFESLLGNRRLKQSLSESFARGKASHLYLLWGPEGSGKHTLARLLSAALVCTGEHAPCGVCPDCRKALAGVHPDVRTVEDPDHKAVGVDAIRRMREDLYVRPNEGIRKVYLFPQEVTLPAQNALLKALEEPPSYGAFLLLSQRPEAYLPTVRSRCVELRMEPLPPSALLPELARRFPKARKEDLSAAAEDSGGYLGQACRLLEQSPSKQTEAFARCCAAGDRMALAEALIPMEKWKRDDLAEELTRWRELCIQALTCQAGQKALSPQVQAMAAGRSRQSLTASAAALEKAIVYAGSNVSPAAICGYLSWALQESPAQSGSAV